MCALFTGLLVVSQVPTYSYEEGKLAIRTPVLVQRLENMKVFVVNGLLTKFIFHLTVPIRQPCRIRSEKRCDGRLERNVGNAQEPLFTMYRPQGFGEF